MATQGPNTALSEPLDNLYEQLWSRLLLYAYRRAGRVGWTSEDRNIARGEGIEDIVQDALASLDDETSKRRWDRDKHPNPMDHLRSFVNSRLSSLRRLYESKHVEGGVDLESHADPETPNPENLAIMRQWAAWRERAEELLLEEIVNDDVLLRMHDLMELEEIGKPADLAASLGITVNEVKNAKKRFARAWTRVIAVVGSDPSLEKGDDNHG